MTRSAKASPYDIFPLNTGMGVYAEHGNMQLPKELQLSIEMEWNAERKKRPELFNGNILHLSHMDERGFFGTFVPYKVFLAGKKNTAIGKQLRIFPIAIQAVTVHKGKILFAKRSEHVTMYPNMLELAPSGVVDDRFFQNGLVNIHSQILSELKEEVNILPEAVQGVEPLCAIVDHSRNICNLWAKIVIHSEAQVPHFVPNAEYQKTFWISCSKLLPFLDQNGPFLIPQTEAVLDYINP